MHLRSSTRDQYIRVFSILLGLEMKKNSLDVTYEPMNILSKKRRGKLSSKNDNRREKKLKRGRFSLSERLTLRDHRRLRSTGKIRTPGLKNTY